MAAGGIGNLSFLSAEPGGMDSRNAKKERATAVETRYQQPSRLHPWSRTGTTAAVKEVVEEATPYA